MVAGKPINDPRLNLGCALPAYAEKYSRKR